MRDLLDRQLGKVTMYRLVTIALVALAIVAVAYTAAGTLKVPFTAGAAVTTLVVLLVASYVSNRLLGLAWRVKPHAESSVITAMLLFFLFWPTTRAEDLAWLAGAAFLANASKYVLAWRGRHIFNPAAAGALLVVIVEGLAGRQTPINATWWIAAEPLLPYVVVASLLVLWRTRRLDIGLVFVVIAGFLTGLALVDMTGDSWGTALKTAALSYPIVFMAGFMVTEPLTLPPRRVGQWIVAVVTAFLVAWPVLTYAVNVDPVNIGVVSFTPELAILLGNLLAFALSRRTGVRFDVQESAQIAHQTHRLRLKPKRPVRFEPGQYVELTLPHNRSDTRGSRRTFSVSSPPREDGTLDVVLRVPEQASSFKRALVSLEPGQRLHATGVGGDFVLPRSGDPVLMVAGGIGITPFASQLSAEPERDAVLVYGVSSAAEVAFTDELSHARVVLVCPEQPANLPEAWTWVEGRELTREVIEGAVPDVANRLAFVSGPPVMVNAVRRSLGRACKAVKTDYFTGY